MFLHLVEEEVKLLGPEKGGGRDSQDWGEDL